jgi:hypothetical protein
MHGNLLDSEQIRLRIPAKKIFLRMPRASTQLLLKQRLVLPSWAVCQADGFCGVAVKDGLDLFPSSLLQ